MPPGIVDFAGRIARNNWSLFGPEKRADLEALNRELRDSQRQIDKATTDDDRQTATSRGMAAASRLLERVKTCPQLIRVDLTAAHPVLTPPGPFELPGDSGGFLFEVVAGGQGLSYATTVFDLSQPQGESSLINLEIATNGTTYAVAGLENLPFGRTTLGVEFRRSGQGNCRLPLDVTTPEPGRLKLTVLSDDTGKPAPAMVRLMWRTDGLARQPGQRHRVRTAVRQAGQGQRRAQRESARVRSRRPSGACRGPSTWPWRRASGRSACGAASSTKPSFEDVTIRPGQTVEQTFRPKRWVDMRKRGWWSGDDHVHCRILSDEDARHLMAWVQAEDIHLANIVKMGDIYRTYFEQRGFGPGYRVVDGDFVLTPGQECPRTHDQIGHTLAMNITSMVRDTDRYFLYDEVFDAVHAQGGLTGYAHVNSGIFHVHRDMSMNVPREKVDFVEILQFNQLGTDLYYEFLNLGCKLTASVRLGRALGRHDRRGPRLRLPGQEAVLGRRLVRSVSARGAPSPPAGQCWNSAWTTRCPAMNSGSSPTASSASAPAPGATRNAWRR